MNRRLWPWLVLALSACTRTVSLDPPDGGPGADVTVPPPPADGSIPRPDSGTGNIDAKCDLASGVDLLLVVDNSNSMAEEQNSLAGNLDALIDALSRPPDDDGDGRPDYLAVRDLRVGVVTTDMGTAGFPVPTCSDDGDPDGDDGVLITRGNTMVMGCAAAYPAFLSFDPRADDPGVFAQELGCVGRVGTGGCGFEQPLEAALKALTPSTSTTVAPFIAGTGHGDTTNAGFLRDDSLLVILLLTDEEDCSAENPEIFNTMSSVFPGEALNLRCFMYGAESYQAVQPISRYVDGFRALRPGRPDLVLFAAIVGVPPDSVPDPTNLDYDAILAHPDMQEMIDPMDPNRLRTSCNVPGLGIAFPPRRIVGVARQMAPHSIVQSICQADLRPIVTAIAREAGRRACLERADPAP